MLTAKADEDQLVSNFMNMMHQFLDALHKVYGACPKVAKYKLGLDALKATHRGQALLDKWKEAMVMYNNVMQPYYARCCARDESLLGEDIEFLHDLDLYSKWMSMDDDTKDATWDYITQLNSLCHSRFVNNQMPNCTMDVVSRMANNILAKFQSNELSFQDLNMETMAEEFESMLSDEEIEQMKEYSVSMSGSGIDPLTMMNMMNAIAPAHALKGINVAKFSEFFCNMAENINSTGEMPTHADMVGNVMSLMK